MLSGDVGCQVCPEKKGGWRLKVGMPSVPLGVRRVQREAGCQLYLEGEGEDARCARRVKAGQECDESMPRW